MFCRWQLKFKKKNIGNNICDHEYDVPIAFYTWKPPSYSHINTVFRRIMKSIKPQQMSKHLVLTTIKWYLNTSTFHLYHRISRRKQSQDLHCEFVIKCSFKWKVKSCTKTKKINKISTQELSYNKVVATVKAKHTNEYNSNNKRHKNVNIIAHIITKVVDTTGKL